MLLLILRIILLVDIIKTKATGGPADQSQGPPQRSRDQGPPMNQGPPQDQQQKRRPPPGFIPPPPGIIFNRHTSIITVHCIKLCLNCSLALVSGNT